MESLPRTLSGIVDSLAAADSGSRLFNPYRERCPEHDSDDAPVVRRNNLRRYLQAQWQRRPVSLWVAEAPVTTARAAPASR